MTGRPRAIQRRPAPGTAREVFAVFLRLGLTSFGGPIAHIGYFRDAVVVRRRWLPESDYAELVALCQFIPGPASSQVGMALGLRRAGFPGMLAAWVAFTLPSAIALTAFAIAVTEVTGLTDGGWLRGLKAAAVAVVAQAVIGMARTLTPDARRATIAAGGAIACLLIPTSLIQLAVIAAAALVGAIGLRDRADAPGAEPSSSTTRVPRFVAVGCLAAWLVLLVGLPAVAAVSRSSGIALFGIVFRAGALVFGGGHVVLPLLEAQTVPTGLVGHDAFLAGYSAAQAVPGPLFTFAAFLGAVNTGGTSGLVGAAVALIGIFLPGALLLLGVLPFWTALQRRRFAGRIVAGVGAGVVGILAAALYNPVFVAGITSPTALAIAIAAFVALTRWAVPAWAIVIAAGVAGQLLL